MTAPDPFAEATKKLLPNGGRPYMSAREGVAVERPDPSEGPILTQTGHSADRLRIVVGTLRWPKNRTN